MKKFDVKKETERVIKFIRDYYKENNFEKQLITAKIF